MNVSGLSEDRGIASQFYVVRGRVQFHYALPGVRRSGSSDLIRLSRAYLIS